MGLMTDTEILYRVVQELNGADSALLEKRTGFTNAKLTELAELLIAQGKPVAPLFDTDGGGKSLAYIQLYAEEPA
jgi:hypothetical protein